MILRVPNKLKEDQVREYQRLFKESHGEDISFEEAEELGMSLLRFYALIISNSGKNK